MTTATNSGDVLRLTTDIVAAHVSFNTVPVGELSELIAQVHKSLVQAGTGQAGEERPAPAVPIRKSVTPNFIICLEDGKKLKMLKRRLKTAYGLTPEQYRERWGLAADYPMVAPNYAQQRSKLAKQIGLGHRPRRRR